jgi:hypothetical protein
VLDHRHLIIQRPILFEFELPLDSLGPHLEADDGSEQFVLEILGQLSGPWPRLRHAALVDADQLINDPGQSLRILDDARPPLCVDSGVISTSEPRAR